MVRENVEAHREERGRRRKKKVKGSALMKLPVTIGS